MKYLKLFERFVSELSAGERAALNRGHEILTEPQAAFCYVIASDLTGELRVRDSDTKFLNVAPTDKDWAAWSEIKPETLKHRVRQIRKLMQKEEIDAVYSKDEPYKKLVAFFNKFEDMSKDEVIKLASACLESPDEATQAKYAPKSKKKLEIKDIENLGKTVDALVIKSMQKNGELKKADAIKKAKSQVATNREMELEDIDKYYTEWIKRRTIR